MATFGKKLSAVGVGALVLSGCSGLIPRLIDDPIRGRDGIACVARYFPLEPDMDLGYDGCGNVWERRNDPIMGVECWILSDDGTRMQKLPGCPAQGDTLAFVPRRTAP